VRLSGEWLNPALNKSTDQLEARHLFLGCGSEPPNLLHHGLRDRHLFFGQLVRPRRSGPKDIGRAKLIKPEFLADSGLVLGIKPPCPPARIVLRRSHIEVFDVGAHLVAETAGLIVERAPDDEDSPLECQVGFDPQEAFAQRDEACYVQDSVGIQIVKLNPISKEEPAEEWMQRKRKSVEKEGKEKYPKARGWSRNDFWPGDENFRRIILQDADLFGALQFLLQELGLDPIAHSERVGIGGLRFFRVAHGGGTHAGTLRKWEQRCAERAEREEEDDDGSGVGVNSYFLCLLLSYRGKSLDHPSRSF
jgi:hypothetical protein